MNKIRIILLGIGCLAAGSAASAAPPSSCVDCHSMMRAEYQQIVQEWKGSIHAEKGIGCPDCHGGDPRQDNMDEAMYKAAGWKGVPARKDIPALCAGCHADPERMRPFNIPTDQYAKYRESVHGRRLLAGDNKVAVCVDCHGTHEIRAPQDVKSSVYKRNIPQTCARCHADKVRMASYGIPTNQFEEYRKSIHGRKLLREGETGAPACADCHGTHGATPPGVSQVPDVCGQCHSKTEDYFNSGAHRAALARAGAPRCVDCHTYHSIQKPDDSMLVGNTTGHCGGCHTPSSTQASAAGRIYEMIHQVRQDYQAALDRLNLAENRHMDVSDARASLEDAKTDLIEARAIQHMVRPEKVEEKTRQATATIHGAMGQADNALRAADRRRNGLIYAGLYVLLASGIIFAKWWQVAHD